MADVIYPDPHVSRRRKRISRCKSERRSYGSASEGDSSEDFALPPKRGRSVQKTPLPKLNSYNSIKYEVIKEKQKQQRKASVRKPKTQRSSRPREDYEDDEDPELKISARMVDRIAALNDGKRTKVGMANCFEDRTALDCIDVCLKESENMQEDAVALAIATTVYSLRVDRTHNDAHETRYTFIRGKSDAEKAMLIATGENLENTKDKRRKKKVEKDAEARKMLDIEKDENDMFNTQQSEWLISDSNNFDYTFGLKFPLRGCSLQHWSFTQEFLERVESRRLDIRKTRRKRKVMSWRKIPPLDFYPMYTDFAQLTANLESDRVDALATFRARRDVTGKIIFLHDAMVRKPASQTMYSRNVDLPTVKQCRDMLANVLQKEPMTWEHYLLEDNPRLYKTGQYLRTGDMTGYVLQERPFYHHFDPEKEPADDPRERFSYVEKNAEKTLYTFKKPPKGTALTRLAPFIRVPVNKYANPRNRKIEDIYFKEDIDVKPAVDTISNCDLRSFIETTWEQLRTRDMSNSEIALINYDFSAVEQTQNSKVNSSEDEEICVEHSGKSLVSRLKHRHQKHLADFEAVKAELKEMARSQCSRIVTEFASTNTRLTIAANEKEIDEEDLKEWKTSQFLETVGMSRNKTIHEDLNDLFTKVFASSDLKDSDLQQKRQAVASVFGTGREAFEWRVPEGAILNDISCIVKRGIHSDIRCIDATYHMKVFKFKVTVEQAHESLRQAERMGAGMTAEELAALKQKCFRPGRYNGIRDSGEVSEFYRVDPWSLDASTTFFSEHYFSCCNYPKLEGVLLQLRNDIQEAAKKIPSSSWYYATNSMEVIDDDRKNWRTRLNDAIFLFTSYMSTAEEMAFWEKRALPKLPQRSLSSLCLEKMGRLPLSNGCVEPQVDDQLNSTFMEQAGKCSDGNVDDGNGDGSGGGDSACSSDSFIFPDNVGAHDEEKGRVDADRPVCMTPSASNSLENMNTETSRKNRAKLDNVEDPPRKREKKVKIEPEVKVEQLEQVYFAKRDAHSCVALEERFAIADPRSLTRSEDAIFLRPKPSTRISLSEYKFENFVKPGLLHKGVYPGVKIEVKNSDDPTNNRFIGILTRSSRTEEAHSNIVTPDIELDVCDAWLTTFGGFRVFPEVAGLGGQVDFDCSRGLAVECENGERNMLENEHVGGNMNDSFNDSVCYSNVTTFKKDRFNDIRPDEFKAIGIDVKNLVPNKDFYSMTKEERAAAVAAEFEAIDALGPKKEDGYVISIMDFSCRVVPYHLNTAKMKRVMKSILSNPLLAYDKVLYTRRALLARRRAVEKNKNQEHGPEVYFKKLDRTLDTSLGPIAEKILERRNPIDITALDPVDVLEAVTYRNLEDVDIDKEPKTQYDPTNTGVEESMRQFAAEVRQADFKVQGLHTFSSVMQCLPRRMGNTGKYVNVANALAVTLYLCNENTLTLLQERVNCRDKNVSVNEGEPWMGNFIITNAIDACMLSGHHAETSDLSVTLGF